MIAKFIDPYAFGSGSLLVAMTDNVPQKPPFEHMISAVATYIVVKFNFTISKIVPMIQRENQTMYKNVSSLVFGKKWNSPVVIRRPTN